MKYLLSLFIVLSLTACSNNKNTTQNKTKNKLSATDSITLTRTACFGRCPIYEVSIQANGDVAYHGKAFVEHEGEYTGAINPLTAKNLFLKINEYDWQAYPERYPIDNVDFPQFKLTYSNADFTKEVAANTNAAKELIELSKKIDELIKEINLTPKEQ